MGVMVSIHYFATDGQFGDAEGILICDSSAFPADAWELLSEALDVDRVPIARQLLAGHSVSDVRLMFDYVVD